jgi:hypothetical protein
MIAGSAVIAGVLFGAAVATTAQSADFKGDAVGSPPKGWMITMTGKGTPRWTAERDDTAPSKGAVLKQFKLRRDPGAMQGHE